MSDGCRSRRTAPGSVRMVLAMLLATAGCQQLPVPRQLSGVVTRTSVSAPKSDTPDAWPKPVAPEPPRELAPLSTTEGTPASLAPTSPPTPLLDEAIERAQVLKTANLEAMSESEPTAPAPPPQPDVIAQPLLVDASPTEKPASDPTGPGPHVSIIGPEPESAAPNVVSPPINPEKPVAVVAPEVLWSEGMDRLRALATEHSSKGDQRAEIWHRRGQWLDVLTRAEREPDGATQSTSRPLLAAILELSGEETPDEKVRADTIRSAIFALEERSPLEINELRLCRKVNGYGNYEPLEGSSCHPAQTLIVYCEMTGLRYQSDNGMYRSNLRSRIELIPRDGGAPVWKDELGTAEDICRHRRRDYFVNYRITLPADLKPGTYALRLIQDDENANKAIAAEVAISVAAP